MESREPKTVYDAETNEDAQDNNPSAHHHEDDYRSQPLTGDGASPGKIFIGGLARETTSAQFVKHFGKYGEITDSVIMKDRGTGQPRGFGFITYGDPSVVDTVIKETHILNGKQVEIKRTIPKGSVGSKDFKTKKIFVGGIPATVNEDELSDFFSKFGEVKEHQIMRDHSSNRSRGFGFVTFESEDAVEELLSKGNKIEFAGTKVEIKKAEPKKPNPPPPSSKRYNDSRSSYGGGFGGDTYGGYGGGGFGPASYRAGAAYGARVGGYGGYGGSEYGGYGGYGAGAMSAYNRGDLSYGYSGRYGGSSGFSRGYEMGGGYAGPSDGYGAYGGAEAGSAYGGAYDSGFGGGSYGGSGGASLYGSGGSSSRGGYGGAAANGRYHPYSR